MTWDEKRGGKALGKGEVSSWNTSGWSTNHAINLDGGSKRRVALVSVCLNL